MKILKISIPERLALLPLMPIQGGKIEMLLVQAIAQKIEFSVDEVSVFNLKDVGDGRISWENGREFEYDLTAEQVEVLKAASKKADEEKKVNMQNLSLIEKIDRL